ncbi:DNA-binding protein [Escherichia coli]|nr:DNA-binding protein [Escherichia coli]
MLRLWDDLNDRHAPPEVVRELARIALASLGAEPDEREAYELFMEKRFGDLVDRRRAKNGDNEYMAWDMTLGWIVWQQRAGIHFSTMSQQEVK